MDLFSLDAVNRDIRTFISVLPARGLPSLASTVSNTTYQPENSSISHASFVCSSEALVGIRVPHSKSDVHSHRVKTQIKITHIRGVLWKKIHVSREQTKITSNIASSWCMVMYSSNPGVGQGPV